MERVNCLLGGSNSFGAIEASGGTLTTTANGRINSS